VIDQIEIDESTTDKEKQFIHLYVALHVFIEHIESETHASGKAQCRITPFEESHRRSSKGLRGQSLTMNPHPPPR
jgi:hypothetical protein